MSLILQVELHSLQQIRLWKEIPSNEAFIRSDSSEVNHSFVIATIPVLLDVETRPLGTPVLVRVPDSGLDSLGRDVGGRSKVVRSFYDRSVRSLPADRYTDDHPDADEDQRRGTFDTFGGSIESESWLNLNVTDMTKVPEPVRYRIEQKTHSR